MEEIIYFSVNNWSPGVDYPDTPKFREWLGDDLNLTFRSDKWAKENKLCIYYGSIDMSTNFTVSAPRSWVEKNCPEILTDEEYTYVTYYIDKNGEHREEHKKKYSDFVYKPEVEDDTPDVDRFEMPFREYRENNFGSEYYETGWWYDTCDDEEEEDDN